MSGVIVGRSELETRDESRHRASGVFRPGLGYELVQPIFDLLQGAAGDADALARYRKARDALAAPTRRRVRRTCDRSRAAHQTRGRRLSFAIARPRDRDRRPNRLVHLLRLTSRAKCVLSSQLCRPFLPFPQRTVRQERQLRRPSSCSSGTQRRGHNPRPDPPLTEAGAARAHALMAVARDAGVSAIITTQYLRTRKTAEPTAMALHLTPEVVDAGPVAQHAKAVADQILKHAGGNGARRRSQQHDSGHRRSAWRAEPRDLCDSEYDQLFVVIIGDTGPPRLIRSRYGAASADDPSCAGDAGALGLVVRVNAVGTSAVSAAMTSGGISDRCSCTITHLPPRRANTAVHAPATV